jgi:hypothetical protein
MKKDYWLEGNYTDTLAFPIDYNDKGVQLYWARILASNPLKPKTP